MSGTLSLPQLELHVSSRSPAMKMDSISTASASTPIQSPCRHLEVQQAFYCKRDMDPPGRYSQDPLSMCGAVAAVAAAHRVAVGNGACGAAAAQAGSAGTDRPCRRSPALPSQ